MKMFNKTKDKLHSYDSPLNIEVEWERLNAINNRKSFHNKLKSENTMLKILLLFTFIFSGGYLINDQFLSQELNQNEKALRSKASNLIGDDISEISDRIFAPEQVESGKPEFTKGYNLESYLIAKSKDNIHNSRNTKGSKKWTVIKANKTNGFVELSSEKINNKRALVPSNGLNNDSALANSSNEHIKITSLIPLKSSGAEFIVSDQSPLLLFNKMPFLEESRDDKKDKNPRARKNSIKLDPIGGWFNIPEVTANFSYERLLSNKISIQLSYDYVIPGITTGTLVGAETREFAIQGTGFVIRPELRYYLFGSSMNGLYFGGSIIYRHVNFNLTESTNSAINLTAVTKFRNLNAGAQVGYQKIFKNGFTLNAFVGLDLGNRSSTNVYEDNLLNEIETMNPDIEKIGDKYFNDLYLNPDFYPIYNFITPKIGLAIGYSF